MTKKIELTQEIVQELLDYDPETGLFFWKERQPKWFKEGVFSKERNAKVWNSKYAGKEASTLGKNGYKIISVFKKRNYAHRLAWLFTFGNLPDSHIDHINGNSIDNRIENLREVDNQENHLNMKLSIKNKSGIPGITWNVQKKKWQASIYHKGIKYFLGYSSDLDNLTKLRREKEKLLGFHINHGRVKID